MQCGRVGSRLFLLEHFEDSFLQSAFFVYIPCGPSANPSAKGLVFPRLAKVVSRMVWRFRVWRKSFPEWFDVSAHSESRFPKGMKFPRLAKVTSRKVWCFSAWRKSFPESFGACGAPANRFLRVCCLRASRKSLFKGFDACGPPATHFLKILTLAGLPQITF